MKKFLIVIGLLLAVNAPSSAHGSIGISFGVFYNSLSPYGEWITVGSGVYGWRPLHVGAAWRPYTHGRWIWTDEGWYWFSDEPWGWAAYHYGRWYYDDYYGWIWIPGYEWAPAWVEWRYGGDYIGWAPLGPYAVFSMNFGVYYRHHWVTPHYYWSFVHCRYITHHHLPSYVYRSEENRRLIGRTRFAGNVRYDRGRIVTRGPERDYVERRGNVRIERAEIRDVDDVGRTRVVRSGERERIEVFRPKIEERAVDRPERLRESDRRVDLDANRIDVRSREVARSEGRDPDRAREYRLRREADQPDEFNRDQGRERALPHPGRSDGKVERKRYDEAREGIEIESRKEEGRYERHRRDPDRQIERRSPERREERVDPADQHKRGRQEFRSPDPERTVRRAEPRIEGRGREAHRGERSADGSSRRKGRER